MLKIDPTLIIGLQAFSGLELEQLEVMLSAAQSSYFAKGEAFYRQGDAAPRFFVLLDGYLQVLRTTESGDQVIMRHFGPGEVFGIAHALRRETYPADAIAVSDCVALHWQNKCWDEFAERFPKFVQNAQGAIGNRLNESQDRIVEMATEQVERRVARAVVRLVGQTGKKTDSGIRIDIPISRQDIAEMCGTTLHTVSRIFSSWVDLGLVEVGRQKIEVLSAHKLVLIAEGR